MLILLSALAPKITGMLLALESAAFETLLGSYELFRAKVQEACQSLQGGSSVRVAGSERQDSMASFSNLTQSLMNLSSNTV